MTTVARNYYLPSDVRHRPEESKKKTPILGGAVVISVPQTCGLGASNVAFFDEEIGRSGVEAEGTNEANRLEDVIEDLLCLESFAKYFPGSGGV